MRPLLRTMSKNLALEWNINIWTGETEISEVVMVPLVHNSCVKLMFAPTIVHQKTLNNNTWSNILVAGISTEINFMSDINIGVSLQQLTSSVNFQELLKEHRTSSKT